MKNLLLPAFLFLSIITNAQGSYQIADTTKKWNTITYGWGSMMVMICGGTVTTRLADSGVPGDPNLVVLECQDSLYQEWDEAGFIREDTIAKQVFFSYGEEEGLIYDFSLTVGDTVVVENMYLNYETLPLVCDSIDQVDINGVMKNRFYLFTAESITKENYNPDEVWIEGIGSNYGILYSGLGSVSMGGGTRSMLCCSQNGITIYMDSIFTKCYYDTFYPLIVQNQYDTAYLNTYYEFQVLVDTGDADSVILTGEFIPEGFTFDPSTGILSGTPAEAGMLGCLITIRNGDNGWLTDAIWDDFIVVMPVSAGNIKNSEHLKVYPNPFSSILNIEFDQPGNQSFFNKADYFMEIYSSEGRLVNREAYKGSAHPDLSNLQQGLYLIRIADNKGKVVLSRQVVKQ